MTILLASLTSSSAAIYQGEGNQLGLALKNGRRGCVHRRGGAVVGVFDKQREQGSSGVFCRLVDEQTVEGIATFWHALVGSFLVVASKEKEGTKQR